MLALLYTSCPFRLKGCESAFWILSATLVASVTCLISCNSMANSSPPRRATMSPECRAGFQPPGCSNQQLVSSQMSHAVVDQFEPIQIEEEDRELIALKVFGALQRPS